MKMDCDLNEIYRLVNDAMNRDEIKAFAAEFRQFPLRLSYSSYADGIRWLAGQYRSFGLETEVVSFFPPMEKRFMRTVISRWHGISPTHGRKSAEKGLPITGNVLIGAVPFSADSGRRMHRKHCARGATAGTGIAGTVRRSDCALSVGCGNQSPDAAILQSVHDCGRSASCSSVA